MFAVRHHESFANPGFGSGDPEHSCRKIDPNYAARTPRQEPWKPASCAAGEIKNIQPNKIGKQIFEMTLFESQDWVGSYVVDVSPAVIALPNRKARAPGIGSEEVDVFLVDGRRDSSLQ